MYGGWKYPISVERTLKIEPNVVVWMYMYVTL